MVQANASNGSKFLSLMQLSAIFSSISSVVQNATPRPAYVSMHRSSLLSPTAMQFFMFTLYLSHAYCSALVLQNECPQTLSGDPKK